MKRVLIVVLLFLTVILIAKDREFVKVGTTAAQFLKVEPGARALAMGGCFSSIANDATALYWNPAGLANIHNIQATFTHTRWIADITNGFVGVVMPVSGVSSVGLSFQYQTMEEMEQTTIDMPKGTGLYFGAHDVAVGITYARKMTDYIGVGITGKYVYQKLWNETAYGIACDIGLILDTGIRGIKLAMVMTNFGTEMELRGRDLIRGYDQVPESILNPLAETHLATETWPLPTNLRVSISTDIIGKGEAFIKSNSTRLTTIADISHPNDYYEQYNFGVEYSIKESIFIRTGYRANSDEEGLTLGGGLKVGIGGRAKITIDYAYADFGIFNFVQHFTVGFQF